MNIFYLDADPKVCAQSHVNKHIIKMVIEYAQILSTAHRVLDDLDPDMNDNLYKLTHKNHPSTIWARSSAANYRWLYQLWTELLDEYTHRYNKQHKSSRLLGYLAKLPKNISTLEQFTEPTQAMPDEYKNVSAITAYRNYYIHGKTKLLTYKNRQIPDWIPLDKLEVNYHV